MARIDKYDPKNGGYRASLAADLDPDLVEQAVGVGHDANGRIVVGAGVSGITGVLVLTKVYPAGKRIDVMTSGEITEFGPTGTTPGTDFGVAGKVYYSDAEGNISKATDEVQSITVTDDPFTLTYSGQTTGDIAEGATPAEVQEALEALSNIAVGDVIVTADSGAADYLVEFAGALQDTDVAAMTATNATIATVTAGGAITGLVRVGHTERGDRLIVRVEH